MRRPTRIHSLAALLWVAPLLLSACGGGTDTGQGSTSLNAPTDLVVDYGPKGYQFKWATTIGATHYELAEDPDGAAGALTETAIGGNITNNGYAYSQADRLLHTRVNASYRVRACDANGCSAYSTAITPDIGKAIGYFKASNADKGDAFGSSVALSADGSTMAVGATDEDSNATGANGNQADNTVSGAGAVYVFTRSALGWVQQAYLKASNTKLVTNERGNPHVASFGFSLSLSSDGSTLAVGAPDEASNARGIDGDQTNTQTPGAGAVYVFHRTGDAWSQQTYLKASNTAAVAQYSGDIAYGSYVVQAARFGMSVSLAADGKTLAVGAPGEASNATGINGDQTDTSTPGRGAVYMFTHGSTWEQKAYIKAVATNESVGFPVALSADGRTLATGGGGMVALFTHDGSQWRQQTVVRGSNTELEDSFGYKLALAADGNTLAVGAIGETTNGTGINNPPGTRSLIRAGAAYVFTRSNGGWSQQAYIKPSNTNQDDWFGFGIALSGDGNTLAVGAAAEAGSSSGLAGNQTDNNAGGAGAVYLFQRSSSTWDQRAYIKASNTDAGDMFGTSVALSADGNTLVVGAPTEGSLATGIQGDQADNSGAAGTTVGRRVAAGAVYMY